MSEIEQDQDYQKLRQQLKSEPREMPPVALDEKILLAARQSVDNHPSMGIDTQPVKRAWYVPVSYVAILVLSLSVVMKLGLEDEVNFENGTQPIQSSQYETGSADAMDSTNAKTENKKEAVSRRLAAPEAKLVLPLMPSRAPEPALSQEKAEMGVGDSFSARQKTQLINKPLLQQEQIKQMMKLLQAERYKELRISLIEYRKQFPYDKSELKLPSELRQWELDNMHKLRDLP